MAKRPRACPQVQATLEIAEQFGATVRVENGGKHRVLWLSLNGRSHKLVCSVSPSDHRCTLNHRTQVRRILTLMREGKPTWRGADRAA